MYTHLRLRTQSCEALSCWWKRLTTSKVSFLDLETPPIKAWDESWQLRDESSMKYAQNSIIGSENSRSQTYTPACDHEEGNRCRRTLLYDTLSESRFAITTKVSPCDANHRNQYILWSIPRWCALSGLRFHRRRYDRHISAMMAENTKMWCGWLIQLAGPVAFQAPAMLTDSLGLFFIIT